MAGFKYVSLWKVVTSYDYVSMFSCGYICFMVTCVLEVGGNSWKVLD